jgi:hypothetical protein
MSATKRIVYILRSQSDPARYRCPHTAKTRPWAIDVIVKFADERRALAFERYLKSGSGCAFAQRHLR